MAYSSCEHCTYYNFNEECDCYECTINLDEDEVYKFLCGSNESCHYFRFSDDYKIVQKQN